MKNRICKTRELVLADVTGGVDGLYNRQGHDRCCSGMDQDQIESARAAIMNFGICL